MKKMLLLVMIMLFNCADDTQSSSVKIIESYINDLKANQITNEELIDKYFKCTETQRNEILPFFNEYFGMVRQVLNTGCVKMEIIKHDNNSNLIKSYKLRTGKHNTEYLYYIVCDGRIVHPVLVEGTKILSVSTVAKSKTDSQTLFIFQ